MISLNFIVLKVINNVNVGDVSFRCSVFISASLLTENAFFFKLLHHNFILLSYSLTSPKDMSFNTPDRSINSFVFIFILCGRDRSIHLYLYSAHVAVGSVENQFTVSLHDFKTVGIGSLVGSMRKRRHITPVKI